MKFLLDTNTVSYYLRGAPATVKHIQDHKPSHLAISAITAMELTYDVEKRRSPTLTMAVNSFLAGIQVLPFRPSSAVDRVELREDLKIELGSIH